MTRSFLYPMRPRVVADWLTWRDADPEFLSWLAGFTDGEGCFMILKNTSKGNTYFTPRFVIGLRDDDEPLLRCIMQETALGRLGHTPSRGDKRGQAHWTVGRKADCQELVKLFRAHPLRSKKARDFEVWAEAVALHSAGYPLDALKEELEAVRQYPDVDQTRRNA